MPNKSSRKVRSGIAGKRIDPQSKAAELYLLNQEISLLLKLPLELRQIIYLHVLGGNKTIFVDHRPHTLFKRWNNEEPQCARVMKGGFHCTVWPPGANPFSGSWMYAKKKKKKQRSPVVESGGFTLLSQVCRQLYIETSTMAMAENIFAFASYNVMNRYLTKEKRMSLAQRRALTTIFVPSISTLNRKLILHLGNLQTVFVNGLQVIEMDPESIEKANRKLMIEEE